MDLLTVFLAVVLAGLSATLSGIGVAAATALATQRPGPRELV